MEKVYITQDESGHWYVIPFSEKERFFHLSFENYEKFEEEFNKYRTGGRHKQHRII